MADEKRWMQQASEGFPIRPREESSGGPARALNKNRPESTWYPI